MNEPDISKIIEELDAFSKNLNDNYQIGNSKIIRAMSHLISVMAWTSEQNDKYSKKLLGLTWAIAVLTVLMLIGLIVQIWLAVR